MKVSQDLSILYYLRYDNNNINGKATICVRITVTGFPKDSFSLGYQVDPTKLDKRATPVDTECITTPLRSCDLLKTITQPKPYCAFFKTINMQQYYPLSFFEKFIHVDLQQASTE